MAQIDIVNDGATSHVNTRVCTANSGISYTYYGSESDIIDTNDSTYWGMKCTTGKDALSQTHTQYSTHEWSTAIHIDYVHAKQYVYSYTNGNYSNQSANSQVYLKIASSWVSIQSHSGSSNPTTWTDDLTLDNNGAGWDDVTGVRAYTYCTAYCYEGGRYRETRAYFHTVEAFTTQYTDIGLRLKTGTSTVNVGVDTLDSSHQVRVYKGGTVYGVPLVDTDHAKASAIRVYDGATVKALPIAD